MTLDEIERSQVNLDIAREAFDQASKRLADMLDTKKAFEQKAFTLFSGYLTLSIALFGVAATLYKDHGLSFTVVSFVIVELTLIAGAICPVRQSPITQSVPGCRLQRHTRGSGTLR
jgi:hypothetical protein